MKPSREPEDLIRAELFSIERLEQHAESLAAAQSVTARARPRRRVTARLRDNGRVLLEAYRSIAATIREEHAIIPAAEWLVDNFHVVDEQIREIRDDLPRGFYRQLPKLAAGTLAGYPRVFGLAWAFVAHSDSRFDPHALSRFVRAYQRVQPLQIGELWAVAISLRIVLVENLRRCAERIVSNRVARREADLVADRLLGLGGREAESAKDVLGRLDEMPLPTAFAVQLIQRLREHDPAVTPALSWLDQRLAGRRKTAEEIVRDEHHAQGAMNVTVRNVITSMRLMSAIDWEEFFEGVSLVDAALASGSHFAAMDFQTRDLYRHAIEDLARGAGKSELTIAERAIVAARRSASASGDATARREGDPGYYLVSAGRRAFEREIGFRVSIGRRLGRAALAAGISGYVGAITILSVLIVALPALTLARSGAGEWIVWLLAVLALVPASDAAVALVNRLVTDRLRARMLPGLELRDGVPPELRTMVVVPTLLTTRADVEEQIERLEVHHLANPDDELRFALLTDWTDSPSEVAADDDELLGAAVDGVARLNRRHGAPSDGERFLLLHRRRVWDEGEGKWIGWERKRGKLHELNRLLRGAADTTFLTVGGSPPTVPSGVRYVITLDADTRLPRGAARRLVGKMAHPLNRPSLDPRRGRVVEGYAVLQPRVTPALPTGRDRSLFQRVFSGPSGIDPYAFVVSDVYQDLFSEGSYSGKGIYEVDAFEAALEGRIPPSTLLSHDLFEGIFARAGLASDIEVVEEYPSRYDVAAARQHRWARGDWQLLPWIFGRGNDVRRNPARRAIPPIGRWKMIDNLRRTLSAPAAFLALSAGWALPAREAGAWTAFVLALLSLPALLPVLAGIVPRRLGISKRSHLRGVATDLWLALSQIFFVVALLGHQAFLMSDAIGRTMLRLFVTRKRLLEWVTAAQTNGRARLDLAGFYRQMAGGVALAVGAAVIIGLVGHESWPLAAPFFALWLFAPVTARWASLPPASAAAVPIDPEEATALRLIARRTWRFFETWVGAEDHLLPPDNFQEEPQPVVAHRTSPTNLGLYLLSVIAARDFGWLGTLETVERLEGAFATMNRLERYRGHFYNWYDTRDLRPLDPKYVSSVDSGNLAGHLIVVGNACREIIGRPVANPRWLSGIGDAVRLARDSLGLLADPHRTQTVTRKQLEEALDALAASLGEAGTTPVPVAGRLAEIARHADTLTDIVRTLTGGQDDEQNELLGWAEATRASIRSHARDLEQLMPWGSLVTGEEPGGVEDLLASTPTLGGFRDRCEAAIRALHSDGSGALIDALARSIEAAESLERRLLALATRAGEMVEAMDFGCLFDKGRQLLSIGYGVAEGSLDPNCYDLLASEARLASFVAIAKGDVPVRHWFRLGRSLTPVDRGSALISWSGSMFEYLMPSLVMRAPRGSLLEHTSRFVVRRQIQYGAELGVPWGVSESAYNARDLELTYQYSNFGIPGLGLKRGLSQDTVIAPYATALAAMVDARAAAENFARLTAAGARGRYGYYEALDYTRTRLPENARVAVVRAYMAHHQGMTLVAIADALDEGAMRTRFHQEPMIRATELLLQERTPRDVAVARPRAEEVKAAAEVRDLVPPNLRRFHTPHDVIPRTHLLSNGKYAVMITAAGSGYSRWGDLAVTRWREDSTGDSWGSYVFLRDARTGEVWSAGYQPSGVEPDSYEVTFSEDRAEIVRRDGTISTTLEVAVSPEDDAEVRRVSISNLGSREREIELTSYAEVVLAPPAADAAHPAFSKLFVQTEFVEDRGVLVANRRPRAAGEQPVWAAHLAVVEGETVGGVQFETDRARFLGRGRGIRTPMCVIDGRPLSNTAGAVLDPVFSLRCRVRLAPGSRARIAFWTLVAPSRSLVLDLVDKHHDATAFYRAVTLAWTHAQVQLYHLGIGPDEANLFQCLANHVLYSDPRLRPTSEALRRSNLPLSGLWAHGISGDVPIVLIRIDRAEELDIVRQLLRADEYWRMKQLAVDLVILNEQASSYTRELQSALEGLVRTSQARERRAGPSGRVFLLRADLLAAEARDLLQAVARAVLLSRHGSLAEQVLRQDVAPGPAAPRPRRRAPAVSEEPSTSPDLEFFNGIGGFGAGGAEYVILLAEGQWTPAPWINVIANESFGFQVSECGAGYTWSVNSRENQLTQWSNDPVGDPSGEVIYVRDEESGEIWGATALPIREEASTYVIRHGQGYSRFEHVSHGVSLDLLQFVPTGDPIKISRLRIENRSGRRRRLSVTAYVEWVLGASRAATAPFVMTELDTATGALFARNPRHQEFGSRVAFLDLAGRQTAWSADRAEFLGRHGTLDHPEGLERPERLSGKVRAGLDPCGAVQAVVDLRAGEQGEILVFLGQCAGAEEARSLIARYRATDIETAFRAATSRWDGILGALQVKTPDRSMDLLLNRWLLYQALACRVWARSAFYQAGGAFGFRDQLQDVMALTVAKREVAREHLLRAAARQFAEGDVQHWWHPPSGRGTRTRIADDALWLPYTAAHYLEVTGDLGLLDEPVPFLTGPLLADGQDEAYFEPGVSEERASFFEHCARALEKSLRFGSHGLPLMGTGDWNDGMNRVGNAGKGESVWLGWFLHATLSQLIRVAEARGEAVRCESWRGHLEALEASLEREAWDGDWYRRAYFDDGTPLGSRTSAECRIDSIAQSWSVISGAGDRTRAARAMAAVEEYLVRRGDGIVLLFTPPFDHAPLDPGYIKGYPPGVRENGGQYTHGAIWTVLGFAALGDGNKAGELFAILNPINHTSTRAGVHRYKAEPYVAAADVYAEPGHVGRGGWTWYTGSAGWMYRAGIEWILGFRLRGATLELDPCVPQAWRGFEMTFRYHSARYEIRVENPHGVTRGVSAIEVDGVRLAGQSEIRLDDDGATHRIRVVLGRGDSAK